MAFKRAIERAQQLETAWHGMARTIDNRLDTRRQRDRSIELLTCAASAMGLAAVVASQFYQLIPYEYAFTSTMAGVALAVAALVIGLWPALKEARKQGTALQDKETRARAHKVFGKKLTQALEHAHRCEIWTIESQKVFEWLLNSMEADVESSIKDLGISGIEGRKHRRIVPRQRKVVVRTRDGRSMTGQIADISLSGVALSEPLPRVTVKDEVLINGRAATIVRIWPAGIALEFKQHLKPETFNEDLIL